MSPCNLDSVSSSCAEARAASGAPPSRVPLAAGGLWNYNGFEGLPGTIVAAVADWPSSHPCSCCFCCCCSRRTSARDSRSACRSGSGTLRWAGSEGTQAGTTSHCPPLPTPLTHAPAPTQPCTRASYLWRQHRRTSSTAVPSPTRCPTETYRGRRRRHPPVPDPPQLRAARSDPSPSPSPAPQVHTAAPSTLPSAPASGTQLPSPAAAAASAAARTACSPAMPGSAYSRLLATPTAVATCLAQCIDGGNETPHVLPPPPRMHACMAHQWARRSAPPGGWRCRSGAGGASRSRPPAAAAGHV